MDPRYRLPTSPLADPAAVLAGPRWRITVLTDGLVRLEHVAHGAPDGAFEDRVSSFALHRDLPVPSFEVVETERAVEVVTERLHLTYDRRPFSPSGPTVTTGTGVAAPVRRGDGSGTSPPPGPDRGARAARPG